MSQNKNIFREDFDYIEAEQEVIIPEEVKKESWESKKNSDEFYAQRDLQTSNKSIKKFSLFDDDYNQKKIIDIYPKTKKTHNKPLFVAGLVVLFVAATLLIQSQSTSTSSAKAQDDIVIIEPGISDIDRIQNSHIKQN